MVKIWYKNSDPTRIISTGKSIGNPDESFIESSIFPDDDEFYLIQNSIIVRKSQAEIDAILAARQAIIDQAAADAAQRDLDIVIKLPSWAQVETAVNNIANLTDAKAFLLKLSRVVYWLAKNKAD